MIMHKLVAMALLGIAAAYAGSTPSSVTLQISANPVVFGQQVTLTAVVTPATAAGTVTFFDGVAPLGGGTLSSGQATLNTSAIAAGIRSIKAVYIGDATFQASISPAISLRVAVAGQNGFQTAVNYAAVTFPRGAAVGDFNGDGRAGKSQRRSL